MRKIVIAAFVLGAGVLAAAAAPSISWAQAPAGLPVGSCVVTGYGSPGVITGTVAGGYSIRAQYGGATLVHHYAGLKAVPCPAAAAAEAKAKSAPPNAPATAPAKAALPTPASVAPRPVAAAGAAAATMGNYHCVLFISGTGLVTQSGFTLLPGGKYTHQLGGGGTTRVANGVIEFTGGPLNGQAGKVSPGRVNLYNAARSRTVIDCDTRG